MEEKKDENKVKKFFINIGKASLYTGIFFIFQIISTFICSIVVAAKYAISAAMSGEWMEEARMTEMLLEKVYNLQGLLTIITGIITLLTLFIIFKIRKRKISEKLSLNKITKSKIAIIAVLAIALEVFITISLYVLPISEQLINEYFKNVNYLMGGNFILVFIAVVIFAPIVEEIIFRGLLLKHLNNVMPTIVAILISSIIFGIGHGQLIWIIYATLIGIILSIVVIRCKSLTASITLHAVLNLTSYIIYFANIEMNSIIVFIISGIVMILALMGIMIMTKNKEIEKESVEYIEKK